MFNNKKKCFKPKGSTCIVCIGNNIIYSDIFRK